MSDSTSYTYKSKAKRPKPGYRQNKGFKKVFNYREIGSDTDEEEAEETPEETSEEDEEEVKPIKKREKPKPKRFMKKRVSSDSENESLQSKRNKQQADFFFSKKRRGESSGRNGKSRGQQSNEGMSSSHVFTKFESTKFFHDFLINVLQSVLFFDNEQSYYFGIFFSILKTSSLKKNQTENFVKKKS